MKKIVAVLLLLVVPTVYASEIRIEVPRTIEAGQIPAPTIGPSPAVQPPSRVTTEGKIIALVGAGLAVTGLVLAATSNETRTATIRLYGETATATASRERNGRRYGGIALAGAGLTTLIFGLRKKR